MQRRFHVGVIMKCSIFRVCCERRPYIATDIHCSKRTRDAPKPAISVRLESSQNPMHNLFLCDMIATARWFIFEISKELAVVKPIISFESCNVKQWKTMSFQWSWNCSLATRWFPFRYNYFGLSQKIRQILMRIFINRTTYILHSCVVN